MLSLLVALGMTVATMGHGIAAIDAAMSAPARISDELFAPQIAWDTATVQQVSAPQFGSAAYARMIPLCGGALLCIYEADGSVFAARSADQGSTWESPVPVAWKQSGINMAAPSVIQLHDGSLLACYNPRPYRISGHRTFGIRTRKSYDGGRTWIHGRLIYEAGHRFADGCWEPAPIQMPDGEIRVYFANEAPFARAASEDQNISMLSSRDGGLTWTPQPRTISYSKGGRDGMPVPLLLGRGSELVCAIEHTNAHSQLQPAILRLSTRAAPQRLIDKNSPRREEPLANKLPPRTYAGAPYLTQLSTGETLLSCQGTEGRPNRLRSAQMRVWTGDTRARRFANATSPFKIPNDRFALWSSLAVLPDDTIVALTSTNAFSARSQVWMIKGHLVPARFTSADWADLAFAIIENSKQSQP